MQVFLQNPYPRKQFYHRISQPNANLRRGIKSHEGALAVTPLIQLKLTHKYIHRQGKKEQYKSSRGGAGKLDLSTKLFTAALSWISFHKSWNCTLGWLKENSFTQEPNTMVYNYTHNIWQDSTRTLWYSVSAATAHLFHSSLLCREEFVKLVDLPQTPLCLPPHCHVLNHPAAGVSTRAVSF